MTISYRDLFQVSLDKFIDDLGGMAGTECAWKCEADWSVTDRLKGS